MPWWQWCHSKNNQSHPPPAHLFQDLRLLHPCHSSNQWNALPVHEKATRDHTFLLRFRESLLQCLFHVVLLKALRLQKFPRKAFLHKVRNFMAEGAMAIKDTDLALAKTSKNSILISDIDVHGLRRHCKHSKA